MDRIPPGLGDLALVGLVLCIAFGLAAALMALATRRWALARLAAIGVVALGALYGVALLGVSLASRERVLPPGAEKDCEGFDPHLHFRVAAVRREGAAVVVTIHVRSDALRAIQDPSPYRVALFDARGRRYPPVSSSAMRPGQRERFPAFARRLAPGESFDAEVRFEPDGDATGLRLLIDDLDGPGLLTIGSEASPLHRKTYFALAGR